MQHGHFKEVVAWNYVVEMRKRCGRRDPDLCCEMPQSFLICVARYSYPNAEGDASRAIPSVILSRLSCCHEALKEPCAPFYFCLIFQPSGQAQQSATSAITAKARGDPSA